MIELVFNHADFEYDVYGLVQAFFPREELETVYDVPDDCADRLPYQSRKRRIRIKRDTEKKDQNTGETAGKKKETEVSEDSSPVTRLKITYETGKVLLDWIPAEGKAWQKVIPYPVDWPLDPAHDAFVRPEMKNLLKRAVYDLLSDLTGRSLPWGTLTGIRPTKVPLRMIEEGKSDAEIENFMKEAYKTSEEKIRISEEIAHREHEILSSIDTEHGVSIYIGIPFCPTTCLYCSFPSYARASFEGQVDSYLAALIKEIHAVANMIREKGKRLDTVYIGGGTPTSLSSEELDLLLSAIDRELPMPVREFTVEAGRPDSIDRDKLRVMKAHGVSRISINPQTMHDKTLKLIGRHHTRAQLITAFQMAREEGFSDINMDLILGLPGETTEDVKVTLDQVKALGPDNLTIHSLAIKAKSRLNKEWEAYQNYAMENSDALMQMAMQSAADMGLLPYYLYRQKHMIGNLENIGFASPGKAGIYNILIMEEKETILALGAGTASKYVSDGGRNVKRTENVRDIPTYIERIDEMIRRKEEAMDRFLVG
ncbi:MAG: coproporphyrinogen dehydrogenase HemZ [Lachnospiraceae bacterium]|nr:coproporphyrinogen dehydrogenase HemZ [Lachnospiraceae bacterium]